MIAVTQARGVGAGQAYIAKQHARGKDKTAALRLLRRRLSDTVFSALRTDQLVTARASMVTRLAANRSISHRQRGWRRSAWASSS